MADKAKKRGCEITVESIKRDLNKGDEETYKSHRYAAAPEKEFKKTVSKIIKGV